jgi:alpha-L-fucosidase
MVDDSDLEAFKDLKFGMFVHWSLFSLPSGQRNWQTPGDAIRRFRAEKFDAGEWVDLAVEGGARYMTFTTKHHDGFCLFDSSHTDFSSVQSPARRDFVALLAEECHHRGMPLFLYYSLPDLNHPSFRPGNAAEWENYTSYYQDQVRELCTGYGEIAGFWFDPGPWHGPEYDYRLTETEEIIRQEQPRALVMGRDFYEAERTPPRLPGEMGYLNDHGEGSPRTLGPPSPENPPFEVCDTVNDSWEYNAEDRNFKSPRALKRKLVSIVCQGGNLLLNQGPMASGEVQREQAKAFRSIGSWLGTYGESIYGTRPLALPHSEGIQGVRGKGKAYLHVLEPLEGPAEVWDLPWEPASVRLLTGGDIQFASEAGRLTIEIPEDSLDPVDTVVEISMW